MKLSFLCLVILTPCWFSTSSASAATVNSNDVERLLDAIARIESNCRPKAVGDGGRALGTYQIHRAYWKDGTRFLRVNWSYRDATDPRKARRVVTAYLLHYGKGKSLSDMARIHNGGPRGYTKKATLSYARKILAVLRENKTALST